MDDEEDIFSDTISVNSFASNKPRTNSHRDYMSLSRNTIYHSAEDLELTMADCNQIEMDESPMHRINDKVAGAKIVTYSQWRNRVTFKYI